VLSQGRYSIFRGVLSVPSRHDNDAREAAMEDAKELRQRAQDHRAAAHATGDLWESVIRLHLAAGYDGLAARREAAAPTLRSTEHIRADAG
jgi:hypothetical protein